MLELELRFGLNRGTVFVDPACFSLKSLRESALQFVDSTGQGCEKISTDRLLLFTFNRSSSNKLELVRSLSQIKSSPPLYLIVVEGGFLTDMETERRFHDLSVHSYRTPTFCDTCGLMLLGLIRQGVKCSSCGNNYHKRCASKSGGCLGYCQRQCSSKNHSVYSSELTTPPDSRSSSILIKPDEQRRSVSPCLRQKVPHNLVVHSYKRPTRCCVCQKILVGMFKQGMQCNDCRLNVHKACVDQLSGNCTATINSPFTSCDDLLEEMDVDSTMKGKQRPNHEDRDSDSEDANDSINSSRQDEESMSTQQTEVECQNIPVQRLFQSVRNKKVPTSVIKDGWLQHYTSKNSTVKRHFWRLDTKSVTLYNNDDDSKYYKEIQLSEILRIESSQPDDLYSFSMRTSDLEYFVICDANGESLGGSKISVCHHTLPDGTVLDMSGGWQSAIRTLLGPLKVADPVQSDSACDAVDGTSSRASSNAASAADQLQDSHDPSVDVNLLYQIYMDEVLGSGQFGIVYGAVHRTSGRHVAVKVINKQCFSNKHEAQLKNEVAILRSIKHPGVVVLERMCETAKEVFVVMEKMKGDMLEMILSSGKLSERVTKFLIWQILCALKYLHSRNVVHCDLKPENVLLASWEKFPQIKICDFGYAKIIGERSFRRSVVGTPAYLAPEVLRNKGYNRSLDMWSVGIIVYVSLSGTFPFNEDEDVNAQIENAAFMYPPDPWKSISSEAISLINSLLRYKAHSRLTVDKTMLHSWFYDRACLDDLRNLEKQLGFRYLTNESDEACWVTYQLQKNL